MSDIAGSGIQLVYEGSAVAQVVAITPFDPTVNVEETTPTDAVAKEFSGSIPDNGVCKAKIKYDPTVHSPLFLKLKTGKRGSWAVVFPAPSNTFPAPAGATFSFDGIIQKMPVSEVTASTVAIMADIEIKISGPIVQG